MILRNFLSETSFFPLVENFLLISFDPHKIQYSMIFNSYTILPYIYQNAPGGKYFFSSPKAPENTKYNNIQGLYKRVLEYQKVPGEQIFLSIGDKWGVLG
jgi:hypothetical protein